jgi:hypothetical protein
MAPVLILSRHPVSQFGGEKRHDGRQDELLPKNGSLIRITFSVQVEPTVRTNPSMDWPTFYKATKFASRIADCNAAQTQALITSNVILPLEDVLRQEDFKRQKETAWVISNITLGNLFQFACCTSWTK